MSRLNTNNMSTLNNTQVVKRVVRKVKKVKRAKKDVVKQNISQEEVLGDLELATIPKELPKEEIVLRENPSIIKPREEINVLREEIKLRENSSIDLPKEEIKPREETTVNKPREEIVHNEPIINKPRVKKATKKVIKRLVQKISNEDPRLKMCRDEILRLYTELERFNNSVNLYRLLHNQPAFRNQINIECFKDDGQINPAYREQLKPKESISKFYVIALEKVDIILIGLIDKSYVDNSDGTVLYEHDCDDSMFKEYFRIIVEHVQKQNVKACTLDNGKLSYFIIDATIQEVTTAIYQLQRHLGETIVDKNNLVEKMLLPPNDFGN